MKGSRETADFVLVGGRLAGVACMTLEADIAMLDPCFARSYAAFADLLDE